MVLNRPPAGAVSNEDIPILTALDKYRKNESWDGMRAALCLRLSSLIRCRWRC